MRNTYRIPLLLLFTSCLFLTSQPLHAAQNFGMQITSGATLTICDQNADFTGCTHNATDLNNTVGMLLFNGAVGGWPFNTTVGIGPPSLVPPPDLMNLFGVSFSTAGAQPITFLLSVTGNTAPLGTVTLLTKSFGTSVLGTTTFTVSTWLSPLNTTFCANPACGTLVSTQVYSGFSWGSTVSGSAPTGVGPYAVTLSVMIDTHGSADTVLFAPIVSRLQNCATCGQRSALPSSDSLPYLITSRREWE